MASRFVSPFYDVGSGIKPPSGALLHFYERGTTTQRDTFNAETALPGQENANPVEADSTGVFPDIWIVGDYDVKLTSKDFIQIYSAVPISELFSATTGSLDIKSTLLEATTSLSLIVGQTLRITDRGDALFDSVLTSTVTPNNYNIVASTAIPSISLVLRMNGVADFIQFGAVGTGAPADDRGAMQAAIDCALDNGFILNIPPCSNYYSVGSKHPTYTDSGLVLDASANGGAASLTVQGSYYKSIIRADVIMTNLVRGLSRCADITINDVYFNAHGLATNALLTDNIVPDDYSPYWTLKHCRFQNAIDTGLALSSFVSEFNNVIFVGCARGLFYRGIGGGPVTSTNFNDCYAVDCGIGYEISFITYGAMFSCAAEECDLAYKISNPYSFSMTSCGAEDSTKAIEFYAARGVSINTFYGLEVGSTDIGNPEPYLIEFVTGSRDVTLNGIYINNTSKYYDFKLRMSSVSNGGENFHILDDSVTREETSISSNNSFTHQEFVFKFAWDQVDRDQTISVANIAELATALQSLKFKRINADVIIDVTGAISQVDTLTVLNIYAGAKKLIIRGNGNTFSRLLFISCDVILDDCDFPFAGGGFNNAVTANKSTLTFTDNNFTSTGNTGAAIICSNNSVINIGSGTTAIGTGYSFGAIYNAYHDSDGTTVWNMSPVTPINNLRLPLGIIVGTIGTTNTLISCKIESPYAVGSPNWKLI